MDPSPPPAPEDASYQKVQEEGKGSYGDTTSGLLIATPASRSIVLRRYSALPGVGKSHLAQGLAIRAIQQGFSVTFTTADALIDSLRRDDNGGRTYRRKYMTTAVLVIDELGFQALDRRDAHHLFRVISYRYEKGATIITSNKSISQWPEMLAGDDVLATAILDRLLHHCHVVNIDGRSFRLKSMEAQVNNR